MAVLFGKEKFKIMSNFYLSSDANESFFPASDVEKVETNIKIIKLVKQLEISKKQPTSEQQELLAKYVGWGGLANSFFDVYNKKYALDRAELKSIVSDDEYRAMKKSSLTAYYTNPAIARAMWDKVVNDGFEGGNVLDPSMGTGIFFMTMPESLRSKTDLYGIELDSITGQIAKYLFPDAHIYIKGFEDFKVVKSPFDLVITNVPFGNVRILDENGDKTYYIHDYFVKKSLDLTNNKGTQMIFSDIGTPTASKGFNIYSQIKQMLIEKGVPANEIAFMHDAKNEDAKLELQRKMNAGEVRVLIGSTQKGGTGLNVQLRMKATHHIDVPWRPSDIIQRNARQRLR